MGGMPAGTNPDDVMEGAGMVRVIVSLMARGRGLVMNAPFCTDIKGLSELEELFAVGVSAANEHRHLQT